MSELREALESLRDTDGKLRPRKVVEYAKANRGSVIGKVFTWNIKDAAEKYWRMEARRLIRTVVVTNREDLAGLAPRENVSLVHDRANDGGYRRTNDVITSADLTKLLIDSFDRELRALCQRYSQYPVPALQQQIGVIVGVLDAKAGATVAAQESEAA